MWESAARHRRTVREANSVNHIDTKFRGRVITVNVERVMLPNGEEADYEIIHHPGGAAIVAIDDQQRVCLVRQFRPAAAGWNPANHRPTRRSANSWKKPAAKLRSGANSAPS